MTSMGLSIALDVAKNIRETGSYELIITNGECIRKMYEIVDEALDDKALYILQTHVEGEHRGKVRSYYKLKF